MISPLRFAWLQIRREKVRFLIALAGIAFAVILMFMQFGFMDALYRGVVNVHRHLLADLVMVNSQHSTFAVPTFFPRRRLYQAQGYPGVASAGHLLCSVARWRRPGGSQVRNIFVMGVDPSRPTLSMPGVEEGMRAIRYPDVVLFDRHSRPEFGPVAAMLARDGEVVTEADRHRVLVRGTFDLGTSFGIDGSLITSEDNFHGLLPAYPQGGYSLGLLRLEPGADPAAVVRTLTAALEPDVRVMTWRAFIEGERQYWAKGTAIGFVFSFGVVMGLVVGLIIAYQILYAGIMDHLAEFATLKAMGYTGAWLAGVVFIQATLLAVIGFVPGLLAAGRLYRLAQDATLMPMVTSPGRAFQVLGLALVMCWLSGLIAMRKLRQADPAEIF
jgi:putative ABC transport system permease protein